MPLHFLTKHAEVSSKRELRKLKKNFRGKLDMIIKKNRVQQTEKPCWELAGFPALRSHCEGKQSGGKCGEEEIK